MEDEEAYAILDKFNFSREVAEAIIELALNRAARELEAELDDATQNLRELMETSSK